MSDRASITFEAEVDDRKARKQLGELGHDALFLSEELAKIMGVQFSATQQLALDMIQQGFLAYKHIIALYATDPFLAAYAAAAYATMMSMEILAYKEMQEKGVEAQQQYQHSQQMIQLVLRYSL